MRYILLICLTLTLQSQYILKFKRHKKILLTTAISQNMDMIATASAESIEVRNTTTNKLLNTLKGFSTDLSALIFHPNSRLIVGGSISGIIYIWNLNNGQLIASFKPHNDKITDIIIPHKKAWIITSSTDKTIQIYNANTQQKIASLTNHKSAILDLDYRSSTNQLLSSSQEGSIVLWDMDSFNEDETYSVNNIPITQIMFNHSDENFISITNNGVIHFWNIDEEKPVDMYRTREESNVFFQITPKKDRIAIGYGDQEKIEILNILNWKIEKTIDSKEKFTHFNYAPNELHLYTLHKKNVRLWEIDFLVDDKTKIELFVKNKRASWLVKGDKEPQNIYENRISEKNEKIHIDKWVNEALSMYGNKKYKSLNSKKTMIEIDEKNEVIKLTAENLEPIYVKIPVKLMRFINDKTNKWKISKASYYLDKNAILLKSAKLSSKYFKTSLSYSVENELMFKGKKIAIPDVDKNPNFKF